MWEKGLYWAAQSLAFACLQGHAIPRPQVHQIAEVLISLLISESAIQLILPSLGPLGPTAPTFWSSHCSLMSGLLPYFVPGAQKTTTKYFSKSNLFSHSGGLKSKIKVSAGLVSSGGLCPWFVNGHVISVFSHGLRIYLCPNFLLFKFFFIKV